MTEPGQEIVPAEPVYVGDMPRQWMFSKYNPEASCPKCTCMAASTIYHSIIHLGSPCGQYYGQPGYMTMPTHMCRVCPRCGCGWVEGFE